MINDENPKPNIVGEPFEAIISFSFLLFFFILFFLILTFNTLNTFSFEKSTLNN